MNQRDMFQEIRITKEIDRLGRILIPKDIRERLALEDSVELILTSEGLLIRNPKYALIKKTRAISIKQAFLFSPFENLLQKALYIPLEMCYNKLIQTKHRRQIWLLQR